MHTLHLQAYGQGELCRGDLRSPSFSPMVRSSPALSPGAPYHHAHRMAVGLEVQSEKVEGDRPGGISNLNMG